MYHLTIDGCEIRCDTLIEALALARAANGNGKTAPARPSNSAANAAHLRERRRPFDNALAFLEAIKDAGAIGIDGKFLWKKAGTKTGAGLGTVVQNARRYLREAGVEFDAAVSRRRSGDRKIWCPGTAIDDAIVALKTKMNELFPIPR